jgi:hypothetical protein
LRAANAVLKSQLCIINIIQRSNLQVLLNTYST